MVEKINNVNLASQSLKQSIDEQLVSLEQVQQGAMSIDTSTQQNAALAEETSAASEMLQKRSGELHHAIRAFKFN